MSQDTLLPSLFPIASLSKYDFRQCSTADVYGTPVSAAVSIVFSHVAVSCDSVPTRQLSRRCSNSRRAGSCGSVVMTALSMLGFAAPRKIPREIGRKRLTRIEMLGDGPASQEPDHDMKPLNRRRLFRPRARPSNDGNPIKCPTANPTAIITRCCCITADTMPQCSFKLY